MTKPKPKLLGQVISELSNFDIQYYCSIKQSYCSGNCSDYCRCTVITGFEIERDIDDLFEKECLKNLETVKLSISNNIKDYVVNRFMFSGFLSYKESFDLESMGGYYGEEVRHVTCNISFEPLLEILKSKTNISAILKSLEMEYGYVLDSLKEYNKAEIKKVQFDSVVNNQTYPKMSKAVIDRYKDIKDFPIGVYTKVGVKYKLVDGNHRFVAAKNNNLKEVNIVALSK